MEKKVPTPIAKYILIDSVEQEIETDSGLLLSADDASSFRYKKGRVIKVGTDVSVISDGDEIYYDKISGHSMVIDKVKYTIIEERNVVVVL